MNNKPELDQYFNAQPWFVFISQNLFISFYIYLDYWMIKSSSIFGLRAVCHLSTIIGHFRTRYVLQCKQVCCTKYLSICLLINFMPAYKSLIHLHHLYWKFLVYLVKFLGDADGLNLLEFFSSIHLHYLSRNLTEAT